MAAYFWVGGSGTWDNSTKTNWATSSGGAGGFGPPTSIDTATFDSLSGTGTCNTTSTATCDIVTLNTSNVGVTLGANMAVTTRVVLTLGTLNIAGFTLTTQFFSSNNTNSRTLAFGSGQLTLTGGNTGGFLIDMATATNFSYTGTPNVVANYSGASLTRNFRFGSTAGATEANVVNLQISAGTDTLSILGSYKNLDFTGFSGTGTPAGSVSLYGNLTFSSGITLGASAATYGFYATSGTQTITTNGKTLDFAITFGLGATSSATTFQLQDSLTMGSTRTCTLNSGTLDLSSGNRTLSTGLFASSNTNTRAIAFGTGNITLTGNAGTIFTNTVITNFTYTGTPTINCTYAGSTGTRTIIAAAATTESNALSFNITAGSDIVTIYYASKNLDFTGFTGTLTLISSSFIVYGDVTISSGMTVTAATTQLTFSATSGTKTFTTNNVPLDLNYQFSSAGSTVKLVGNLTSTATKTCYLVSGTLDLNNNTITIGLFLSSYSIVRAIAFGATGKISVIGNAATVCDMQIATNFSYTGTSNISFNYAGATGTRNVYFGTSGGITEANVPNFNVSAGSDIVDIRNAKTLNFTGFTGTISNGTRTIYGSLTLVAGMTLTAGANATTFGSTASSNTITSAGKTIDFPITFNGIGGVWTCQDALTLGSTRALTMTNGTLKLKSGTTSTVGSFVTSGTNQKYLGSSTPGTQATISDASGVNSVSYMTISDSFATGGATWDAFYGNNNVDFGNNTNWDFGESPVLGNEYEYKLRSFTQPRRF